jgi:gas vesicle protein
MRLDQREWIGDIVTGGITGVIAGAVAAVFLPEPPIVNAIFAGGCVGVITGLLTLPMRWLLGRRSEGTEQKD